MPTVAELAEFLGAPVVNAAGSGGIVVRDIVDDSRSISSGDAYLAVPGHRWHGLEFEDEDEDEDEVVRAGAVVAISDRPADRLPTVVVDDPRTVAGPLAAWFHGDPSASLRVYGVTGTNGKTSTAHLVHAGLRGAGRLTGLISGAEISGPGFTLTPTRTTPEASVVQRTLGMFRHAGCRSAVMEVSSHAVENKRVDGVRFQTMALTNLSPEHLDFHGSMEAYFRSKASLFVPQRTSLAVVSIDDEYGVRLAERADVPTWTCSVDDASADVHAADIVEDGRFGHRLTVHTPDGTTRVRLQVRGPHQVANAVVAMAMLVADGVDADAAADGMSALQTIPGRCEPVQIGQSFTALVDYMHNVAGQQALLPFLRNRTPGRLIVVIGATGDRDPSKRRPLGRTAAGHADIVIVTDESPGGEDPADIRSEVVDGARSVGRARVIEIADRDSALREAVRDAGPGDTVVIAGRGSDCTQVFGDRTIHFDDHARLTAAIADLLAA